MNQFSKFRCRELYIYFCNNNYIINKFAFMLIINYIIILSSQKMLLEGLGVLSRIYFLSTLKTEEILLDCEQCLKNTLIIHKQAELDELQMSFKS